MKIITAIAWVLGAALALSLSACATGGASGLKQVPGRSCQEPEELVDMLTRFANAVSHKRYHEAISYLSRQDQARMLDSNGAVSETMQRQLSALNFSALANNPKIDLKRGKLTGIFDCLPCLDMGPAAEVKREESKPPEKLPDPERKKLAALSQAFFRDIQAERWNSALDRIHPQEREVFLPEGKLSELDKSRFRAVEECDLEALTLREGRLVGVVMLLDPPVSALWLKSRDFFALIDGGRYDRALDMLVESERRQFVGPGGRLRKDREAQLKYLDRSQWRKLHLYSDHLMGVTELALWGKNL